MIETVVSIDLPVGERMEIRKNRHVPINQNAPLPRINIVTGTHGDELEGQYVCYRINQILSQHPEHLSGIVDIYPALNPLGVDSITRGIPRFDLDMNRIFPGDAQGTTEELIAWQIIQDMKTAQMTVDIHASNIFLREIPQVRVNVNTADTLVPLAKELNCDFIWVHAAATVLESTLAHALNSVGSPCLVVEMGVGMRITKTYGERLVAGLLNLMKRLGIWTGPTEPVTLPIVSTDGKVGFVNAGASGIFVPEVEHWNNLHKDQLLGRIIDPTSGTTLEELTSPCDGLLFTLREYPVVNPGSLIARVLEVEMPQNKESTHD
ncbi:MAG: succinylglutamate desuccinylase/aspartoacylase family protein [Duodenibacillus sp.]|nr:succinylglutamate desuccinylase/aspartoacylase family protein [Duodenibacillus sp.]